MDIVVDGKYRVDHLLEILGYKVEELTPKSVNELLYGNGLAKYFSKSVDANESKEFLPYYNDTDLPIDFGRLATYTTTDIANISNLDKAFLLNNPDIAKTVSCSEVRTSTWHLSTPLEKVEVLVALTSEKDYFTSLCFARKTVIKIVNTLLKPAIEATGEAEAIYSGQKIAQFKFTFNDKCVSFIDAKLVLKLACAMNLIKNEYPEFEFTCVSLNYFRTTLNCYYWVYRYYELTSKAYDMFFKTCHDEGVDFIDLMPKKEEVEKIERIKNSVAKQVLLEELKIKVGDVVLFSVAPFSIACAADGTVKVETVGKDNNENFAPIQEEQKLREVNGNTFFIARVKNYNDTYLVLRVAYKKASSTDYSFLSIPIPWEKLLADFTIFHTHERSPEPLFTSYKKCKDIGGSSLDVEKFLTAILNIPLLLTEAVCLDLKHPANVLIYGDL